MKITTKYDLGDEVWYMGCNRPESGKIRYIYINLTGADQYQISYIVGHFDSGRRPEETLYKTKKDLIATL